MTAGDIYVTNTEYKGQSAESERGMLWSTLLELYEAALNVLQMEEEAAAGGGAMPGSVHYADFSRYPSILG